jgi:hypothetical protein
MPKKLQTGAIAPVNSLAFPNGQVPDINLSAPFASALGQKPQVAHPGTAFQVRPEKQASFRDGGPHGRVNGAARPNYVPGKGHK